VDELTAEDTAEDTVPIESEESETPQFDEELERHKWKARVYLTAGLIPGGLLWGFIIGKSQSAEPLTNLAIAMASLLVALPLLVMAMIHAHRYSKATGKWFWI
jgi:hypothetical protein